MVLSAAAAENLRKTFVDACAEFLDPKASRTNVVGLGLGIKWKDGRPTGVPALVILVTRKRAKHMLNKKDLVPKKLHGLPTDVLSVGYPRAGVGPLPSADDRPLSKRVRPAKGGCSVGHVQITAGTIATCVYDILPEGSTNPPTPGVGMPRRYYLLSNNHVLANSNEAKIGDPILQPGPYDGGKDLEDRIAVLRQFVPITFEPPTPRDQHQNLVDAAVAEGAFDELDREVYWCGRPRGWRPKSNVTVGTMVQKTGRTTHYSIGRITVINATIDVNYGGGYGDARMARFHDQIVTTPMSAGGDSGSLVMTLDNVAVGLLFAGSNEATILNQIEHVRALLGIEVAEQIL